MTVLHDFKREERLPSYFMNRIQDFLSAARTDLRMHLSEDLTKVEVIPLEPYGIAAVNVEGRWRFSEEPVVRVHPGGSAGTYWVWAVATDQNVVEAPDPFTDETDYGFELRITPEEVEPEGEGVEIKELLATVEWTGVGMVFLKQLYNGVTGEMLMGGGAFTPDTTEEGGTGHLIFSQDLAGRISGVIRAKAIHASLLQDALRPSQGAATTTEALRALGTGANNAAAGNDARLSRPIAGKVNANGSIHTGTGFSVEKTGVGSYTVILDEELPTNGVIVASANWLSDGDTMKLALPTVPGSKKNFPVFLYSVLKGTTVDAPFSFHVK